MEFLWTCENGWRSIRCGVCVSGVALGHSLGAPGCATGDDSVTSTRRRGVHSRQCLYLS